LKFKPLTSIIIFGLIASIIWSNSNNTNTYAQLSNQTLPTLQPTPTPKLHAVKITSPTAGQQVPVGRDLRVMGTSLANQSSNCHIVVGLNHVKPSQNATAVGLRGANDYSKWNFDITSKYTTIKQGPNRISAKYTCTNTSPNLLLFDSVNVIGTSANGQSIAANKTSVVGNTVNNTSIQTRISAGGFSLYENSSSGIKLQYPANWTVQNNGDKKVSFYPPQNKSQGLTSFVLVKVIDTGVSGNNITLDQINQAEINFLSKSFNLINSTDATLGLHNFPAHLAYYEVGGFKAMKIWTLQGNKIYIVTYAARSDKYLSYLPGVQKMLGSFEAI
jgi:photosystem II reaction center protein PsbP